MQEKIKVLIVDDDPNWLDSIEMFLNDCGTIEVVGKADNEKSATELVKTLDPEIVLLDVSLTQNNFEGIYIASTLRQLNENIKIIMLSCIEDEEIIINAFNAGSLNYVNKTDYEQIPYLIESIHNNRCATGILAKKFASIQKEILLSKLSAKEKELINLISKGYTQTQISDILYKSKGTIRCQINKMLKKLGVKSSKEAIKKLAYRSFYSN